MSRQTSGHAPGWCPRGTATRISSPGACSSTIGAAPITEVGEHPLLDPDAAFQSALLQRRLRPRARPSRHRRQSAAGLHHGVRPDGRGSERRRRAVPRRQRAHLPPARLSRRFAARRVGRARPAHVGLPQGLRHRHLAHQGLQPARRAGHRLQAHQSRSPKERPPNALHHRRAPHDPGDGARLRPEGGAAASPTSSIPRRATSRWSCATRWPSWAISASSSPSSTAAWASACFEYCLVTEELSRGWMSVASLIARGNLLIGGHMMSEEQRARYLPRMARGEFLGAFVDVGAQRRLGHRQHLLPRHARTATAG